MNFIKKLFPGIDPYYYIALNEQSQKINEAANIFCIFTKKQSTPDDGKTTAELVKDINAIENAADEITKESSNRIKTAHTWQLPFDGDLFLALINQMDDVIDFIKSASNRMELYSNSISFPDDVYRFSLLIDEASEKILSVCSLLPQMEKHWQKIYEICDDIDSLETKADQLNHKGIENLFQAKPLKVEDICLERVYDMMEDIMDSCEDVAKTIASIVVRQV